ncbi:flagellar hook-basal body complex protein [Clostridium botulinum]|uniref:flagellar hook-basal body complex protein n=1 Tax=Clostridium botulinum TaxID=1491 RepID=UPI000D12E9BE|nr:flagellar hook-basal body complex protein [Clostridium botulinum]AVQ44356.1 flagellar biosynthesis protein FlgE [Clostridium botulinum]AVQ47899.1 flagellar biosynthesis protein FlgE [Clostridium botulinum]
MLRSMYSGISGLKAQQTKLDIVGNNIANANTTAFKSQNIRFQDMLSQNMSNATGPSANLGGTNPRQVGLGVQVSGIYTKFTTGNMQTTGRNLDAAIDGPGFFIVGKGALPKNNEEGIPTTNQVLGSSNMNISFTRDGSFNLDKQGNLLNSDGLRIMGYAMTDGTNTSIVYNNAGATMNFVNADAENLKASSNNKLVPLKIPDTIMSKDDKGNPIEVRVQSFSIDKDGLITASLVDGTSAALGQIAMASFKNEGGLEKAGRNLYTSSANSGEPIIRSPRGTDKNNDNSEGYGNMIQSMIEMSNVDLAEEFTEMIVANRAFQACGKMITTGDEILQELVNLKR